MIKSLVGAKQKRRTRKMKRLVFTFNSQGEVLTIDGTLEFDDQIAELKYKISETQIEYAINDFANIPFEIMKMTRKLLEFMKEVSEDARV